MSIIIDACCLASVFKQSDANHGKYIPVYDWIYKGKGFMVYGGSKYIKELATCKEVLRIVNKLKLRPGKVVVLNKESVDKEEKRIKDYIPAKDFDDPQLAAISIIGKCMLICSRDDRSHKYVKNPKLYPKGMKPPKYYTSNRNANILNDAHIHHSYKKKPNASN